MPAVAIVTCSILPDLFEDDRPVLGLLAERGVDAVAAVWDDPAVDWAAFDLAVVRNPWAERRSRTGRRALDRHDGVVMWREECDPRPYPGRSGGGERPPDLRLYRRDRHGFERCSETRRCRPPDGPEYPCAL